MFNRPRRLLVLAATVAVLSLPALGFAATSQFNFAGDLSAAYGPGTMTYANDTGSVVDFGTASSFGLPALPGGDATVLKFPAFTNQQGLLFDTASSANGGGSMINQYTMIWDILIPDVAAQGYMSFYQTDPTNSNDGEFFLKSNGTIGIGGQYNGNIQSNNWYRIAVVVDNTTDPTYYSYINGVALPPNDLFDHLDDRYALSATESGDPTWLFADESTPAETGAGYVSSFYFTDHLMSDSEIAALGGPSAAGVVPEPGTLVLLVLGAVSLLAVRLWKRR